MNKELLLKIEEEWMREHTKCLQLEDMTNEDIGYTLIRLNGIIKFLEKMKEAYITKSILNEIKERIN
jgi:hypothetical protein